MYLNIIAYDVPTIDCVDHFEIDGIKRSGGVSQQYIRKHKDELRTLHFNGRIGLIYAAGVTSSAGVRCSNTNFKDITIGLQRETPIVMELAQNNMYAYARAMDKIDFCFAEVESSSCSSSLTAIVKATKYLELYDLDRIVVVCDERVSQATIKVFKESRIDVKPGDGFCLAVVSRASGGVKISEGKLGFKLGSNPFDVCQEGYESVISNSPVDFVKTHGTGTDANSEAEDTLTGSKLEYKSKFGHMQGASGLVEMAYMLDKEDVSGKIQCVASGLGGFYAGIVLYKRKE